MAALRQMEVPLLTPIIRPTPSCPQFHIHQFTSKSHVSRSLNRPSYRNLHRAAENYHPSARVRFQPRAASSAASQPSSPPSTDTPNPEVKGVAFMQTMYNTIRIVDVAEGSHVESGGRLLFLDDTTNIHSALYKDDAPPGSYWDEFAAIIPLLPPGPIGVLGLAGGTMVRSALKYWPERRVEGWEIDEVLVDFARLYLRLGELEEETKEGGGLRVHIGDAFGADVNVEGGFAGLFVDLFSDHKVPPQLTQTETLKHLLSKLRPDGRLIVNLGGYNGNEEERCVVGEALTSMDTNVNIMEIDFDNSNNVLVMTGQSPDSEKWKALLPAHLQGSPYRWRNFESV